MSTSSSHHTVGQVGEHALIARIVAKLSTAPWVVVGPGDDAAVIRPPSGALDVLTTDTLVDGVHFDSAFVPPDATGHRALAVNLSDLAAMGATPRAALLSLSLPPSLPTAHLDAFVDGVIQCARDARVTVVGGNITHTPGPWTVTIALTGTVRPRRLLTRDGARPGDGVYVSGWLGAAGIGLRALRAAAGESPAELPGACVDRYLRPRARLALGQQLGHHRAATSCMDLSDGLGDGVHQLAHASHVGMVIDAAALPISPESHAWCDATGEDPVTLAMTAGDDYELLFTVRPRGGGRLRSALARSGGGPVTRIGVVTAAPGVQLARGTTLSPMPGGFEHFR